MAVNVDTLATSILTAMKGVLDERWPDIKDYAGGESQKLAHSLVQIATLRATGQITEGECSVMLEMQKNATRTVLLAVEGMGLIMVEMAINAALAAVKGVVNDAIGFALL
jgi:hypothetical protein